MKFVNIHFDSKNINKLVNENGYPSLVELTNALKKAGFTLPSELIYKKHYSILFTKETNLNYCLPCRLKREDAKLTKVFKTITLHDSTSVEEEAICEQCLSDLENGDIEYMTPRLNEKFQKVENEYIFSESE